MTPDLRLSDIRRCFDGAVPTVISTTSGAGVANVTHLSRAFLVDDERLALSNQFFSKTSRNLAENPRASVLLIDPVTYAQYRLSLVFERTERRGHVFDQLRVEIDLIGALTGMQDVFRLRAADIYRVVAIEEVPANQRADGTGVEVPDPDPSLGSAAGLGDVSETCRRMSRCGDLDSLVEVTLTALDELLGHRHAMVLLADETASGLFLLGARGYDVEGIGSEVGFGDGVIGLAAQRGSPVRVGDAHMVDKYGQSIRRSYEASGEIDPADGLPLPGLADVRSQLAVPAVAKGELVGVFLVESPELVAYDESDEWALGVVASLLAGAVHSLRADDAPSGEAARSSSARPPASGPEALVRCFSTDGSTFVDGEYLIKGVAGRILRSLLDQYEREGRTDFSNKEVRLDPSLDMPDFRDNFESRLILLKRRLDERDAPIRIDKTGRGQFRLDVRTPVRLETVPPPTA